MLIQPKDAQNGGVSHYKGENGDTEVQCSEETPHTLKNTQGGEK